MGKGDKKSRRGKIFQGSFGVRRPKQAVKTPSIIVPAVNKPLETAEVKKVMEVKEPKAVKETAPVKAPKAAAAAKKEPKPKKEETVK